MRLRTRAHRTRFSGGGEMTAQRRDHVRSHIALGRVSGEAGWRAARRAITVDRMRRSNARAWATVDVPVRFRRHSFNGRRSTSRHSLQGVLWRPAPRRYRRMPHRRPPGRAPDRNTARTPNRSRGAHCVFARRRRWACRETYRSDSSLSGLGIVGRMHVENVERLVRCGMS